MRYRLLSLVPVLVLAACSSAVREPATPRLDPVALTPTVQTLSTGPTRVILFIGDGVGTAYWSAARFAQDRLAIEEFPVVGLVDTRSSSHKVTDSAAGATVYALGLRTYNNAIGVGPDSVPGQTVLERAAEKGMATGLVATSTITHATPGSFGAHVPHRRMESEIARQLARQPLTVALGGGLKFFDGSAPDADNLLPALRERFTFVASGAELRALQLDTVRTLFGLFAEEGMPAAHEGRTPALAEMVGTALQLLDREPNGFFAMFEASQPDWRGHDNRPLDEVTAEMLDYDKAIRVALEYQARHPETLIVITADHETGGLSLVQTRSGGLEARYTTTGHTGSMIPLFAKGPGAERFAGVKDNYRIGQLLGEVVEQARTAPRAKAVGAH
jgi:alkaline phosphatase